MKNTNLFTKTNKNQIRKLSRKLQKKFPIFFDRKNDYRNTVLLAGAARSGTTWLADIINYKNDYRLMFEPFQARKVNLVNNFKHGQYIRPENKDEKFLSPAREIFSGKFKHPGWVDSHNRKVFCRRRLVKVIHANLMLKWIKVNFPEIPIILLLRHPCAVALSRLRLKHWDWTPDFKECISQNQLFDDYLKPVKNHIDKVDNLFDMHIFSWCIANYIPLQQFKPGEIHIVFYERLCTDPQEEVRKLFAFLGSSYNEKVIRTVFTPSELSFKHSAINAGQDLISNYKDHLSADQIQRTVEILSLFGLDKIYSAEPVPLLGVNDVLELFSKPSQQLE